MFYRLVLIRILNQKNALTYQQVNFSPILPLLGKDSRGVWVMWGGRMQTYDFRDS